MADIFDSVDWQTVVDEPCAYCGVVITKGTSVHVIMDTPHPCSVHKSCWALAADKITWAIACGRPSRRAEPLRKEPAPPNPNQLELLSDGKVA